MSGSVCPGKGFVPCSGNAFWPEYAGDGKPGALWRMFSYSCGCDAACRSLSPEAALNQDAFSANREFLTFEPDIRSFVNKGNPRCEKTIHTKIEGGCL